jgi:hypothetical protein
MANAASQESKSPWRAIAERATARLAVIKEKNSEDIRAALDTIESAGTAGFLGYMHGRRGGMPMSLGVPWDLGTALAAKLAGFLKWGGSFTPDLHAIGNGAASYYLGSYAADWGQRDRKKAGELLGRAYTADEAKEHGVVVRTITAGADDPRYVVDPYRAPQFSQPAPMPSYVAASYAPASYARPPAPSNVTAQGDPMQTAFNFTTR